MYRFLAVGLLLMCSAVSCSTNTMLAVVRTITQIVDAVEQQLLQLENQQSAMAYAANSDSAMKRQVAIDTIARKWIIFWDAWRDFKSVEGKWLKAVEQEDPAVETYHQTTVVLFCNLPKQLPSGVPVTVLQVKGLSCPTPIQSLSGPVR